MLEKALWLCAETRFLPLMERRKSSISTHYYLQAFNQSSKFAPWECQDDFAGSQARIGARANATEAYRG
jgi:hypothetical protein